MIIKDTIRISVHNTRAMAIIQDIKSVKAKLKKHFAQPGRVKPIKLRDIETGA